MSTIIIPYWYNYNMEPKVDGEPAEVSAPVYKPLPAEYKPYEPSEAQKRSFERLLRKKRSKRR